VTKSGAVFFGKEPVAVETINDISRDESSFFPL
jgi:hypothetical protein